MLTSDGRATLGVVPAAAQRSHSRLWGALEAAYPVRFEPREAGQWQGLDAVIMIGDSSVEPPPRIPSLITGPGCDEELTVQILFCRDAPSPFAGRALRESRSIGPPVTGDLALAVSAAGTLWSVSNRGAVVFRSSVAPLELQADERLKDHLRAGRFFALLPLVHLLRHVTGETAWSPPALRASYIIDDPNLHWKSYGWLDYDAVGSHAQRYGYHLGVAMIPLDSGLALSSAVRRLRTSCHLSILIHGNNHLKCELATQDSGDAAMALVAQALRRIARFESRQQMSVGRVMVPPHGVCSAEMMEALRRVGFDAIAYNGPPGGDGAERALTGWDIADLHLGGGFPGIHRNVLDTPVDELTIQAYLGQPLLLYGHHGDLAEGLDPLAVGAARVAEVGDAQWTSCAAIARSSVATRVEGDTMRLRMWSRRAELEIPAGVGRLTVELPWTARRSAWERVRVGRVVVALGEAVDVTPGQLTNVALIADDGVDPVDVPGPAWHPWPILRRCMTEGRDRLLPIRAAVTQR